MTKFNLKAALAATLATSFLAAPAMAAPQTGSFNANATIIKPLTMSITDSMEFGSITLLPAMGASANVSVAWNAVTSTVDRTCGAGLSCAGTPLVPNIAFTGGVGSQTVSISYTPPANLTYTDPVTLAVSNLPFALDLPQTSLTLTNGAGSFKVDGTVTVPSTSPEGTYSGTVNVSADYN